MPFLYPITKKWKEVELWKYKQNKKNKCIFLGIKDDKVPPKFVIPIGNTTLKDHNSYESGLKNIKL
jgi:hypothetical protein